MVTNKQKATERAERARALLVEQKRRERNRNLVRGGIVVVVMALVVLVAVIVGQHKGDRVDENAAAGASDYSLDVGPDDAPHHVVVYEDFLCPFCGMLEASSHSQLQQLADAGKVQVSYRPFDLLGGGDASSYSVRAAAAFAVVEDKSGDVVAKKFHDLLYADQPSEAGPFPDDDALLKLAVQAGANQADVQSGIDGGDGIGWVTGATSFASSVKVSSTPTVLLDGQLFRQGGSMQELAQNLVNAVS